jgi:hypothetical protein
MHKSKLRPTGFDMVNDLIYSLYDSCSKDFILYLLDNTSDEKYDVLNYPNIDYTYIKDQNKNGVIGADYMGIGKAIKDNCDIIVVVNDDVVFNNTINNFLDIIEAHEYRDISLYGALSNGVPDKLPQKSYKKERGIIEITKLRAPYGILSGFLYAFTSEFHKKFTLPDGTFYKAPTKKWSGVGVGIHSRIKSLGGRIFIIKDCWLFHHKIRGWKQLADKEKANKRNESKNKTKNPVRRKRASRK